MDCFFAHQDGQRSNLEVLSASAFWMAGTNFVALWGWYVRTPGTSAPSQSRIAASAVVWSLPYTRLPTVSMIPLEKYYLCLTNYPDSSKIWDQNKSHNLPKSMSPMGDQGSRFVAPSPPPSNPRLGSPQRMCFVKLDIPNTEKATPTKVGWKHSNIHDQEGGRRARTH